MATEQAQQQSDAEAMTRLRELIDRARKGDAKALPLLRKCLDRSPAIWRRTGNLALQAQMALIKAICGPDLFLRECVARQVNQLKAELSGDAPVPLEKLAIERIVTAFLEVGHVEARNAQHPESSLPWAKFAADRQDRASRRLLTAMNALAQLRKLQRPLKVEIHQVPAVPQVEPAVLAAHGNVHGGRTASVKKAGVTKSLQPVNGTKLNGHNRMTRYLTPVGAAPEG